MKEVQTTIQFSLLSNGYAVL